MEAVEQPISPSFGMPVFPTSWEEEGGINPYEGLIEAGILQAISTDGLVYQITIKGEGNATLASMAKSFMFYYAPGETIPRFNQQVKGEGALVFKMGTREVTALKDKVTHGKSVYTRVLFNGIQKEYTKGAIDYFLEELAPKKMRHFCGIPESQKDQYDAAALLAIYKKRFFREEPGLTHRVALLVKGQENVAIAPKINEQDDYQFDLSMLDAGENLTSPVAFIRAIENNVLTPKFNWKGHPLKVLLENVPEPTVLDLKFEFYDPEATDPNTFVPVPAGIPVSVYLQDLNPQINPNDTIDGDEGGELGFFPAPYHLGGGVTTADGKVHVFINTPIATPLNELYFKVDFSGLEWGDDTVPLGLPDEWNSKGWKSVSGEPGSYYNWLGGRIGDPTDPLVFRIGTDLHVRWKYVRANTNYKSLIPAGIPISLYAIQGEEKKLVKVGTTESDKKGETRFRSFLIQPNDLLYFQVDFELADPAIHLTKATVDFSGKFWLTLIPGVDNKIIAVEGKSSLRDTAGPIEVLATGDKHPESFFALYMHRELGSFMHYFFGDLWRGFSVDMVMEQEDGPVSNARTSGLMKFTDSAQWRRKTYAHEIGHQISYEIVGRPLWSSILKYDLKGWHNPNMDYGPDIGLVEGWAEFLDSVLSVGTPHFYPDFIEKIEPYNPGGKRHLGFGLPPYFVKPPSMRFGDAMVVQGASVIQFEMRFDLKKELERLVLKATKVSLPPAAIYKFALFFHGSPFLYRIKDITELEGSIFVDLDQPVKVSTGNHPFGILTYIRDKPTEGEEEFYDQPQHLIPPYTGNFHYLGKSPAYGAGVEGAVSEALNMIFQERVLENVPASDRELRQSENGDLAESNPWLKNSSLLAEMKRRCQDYFYRPLTAMDPLTSVNYFERIKAHNSSEWHLLSSLMGPLNVHRRQPVLVGVTPQTVSTEGGDILELNGKEFMTGMVIQIDQEYIASEKIDVRTQFHLAFETPPMPAGSYRLRVLTPAGKVEIPNFLTYEVTP